MIFPDTKAPDLTIDTAGAAPRRPSARCQRYHPAKTGCLMGKLTASRRSFIHGGGLTDQSDTASTKRSPSQDARDRCRHHESAHRYPGTILHDRSRTGLRCRPGTSPRRIDRARGRPRPRRSQVCKCISCQPAGRAEGEGEMKVRGPAWGAEAKAGPPRAARSFQVSAPQHSNSRQSTWFRAHQPIRYSQYKTLNCWRHHACSA